MKHLACIGMATLTDESQLSVSFMPDFINIMKSRYLSLKCNNFSFINIYMIFPLYVLDIFFGLIEKRRKYNAFIFLLFCII